MSQGKSDYAETNAKYIFHVLEKMGTLDKMEYADHAYDDADIPHSRGVYMFYISSKDKRYPVYLGKTEVSFKSRFAYHEKNGVIYQFKNEKFPFPKEENKANLLLRVALLTIDTGFTIKLVESLFLAAFDFALNKMENGNVRETLGTIPQMEEKDSYGTYMWLILEQLTKDADWLQKCLPYT